VRGGILKFSAVQKCVVSFTLLTLYPPKRYHVTHKTGSHVDSTAGLDEVLSKLPQIGERSPNPKTQLLKIFIGIQNIAKVHVH
jgi:hypothetical protein